MARPLDLDNKASFSDKLLDDWNNACDFVRQNFFFIISGILLVSTIYTTISFLKDYLNLSTMAANANMTLFSLKCLLTIAALFIVALIVIICKKLYEQSLIPSIKHQMSISPYTANPVKHLGKGVKGFLQWFGKESRKRTIIYAMMGFAYVFPATMLFLTYYGHVIFSGPLAAINKVFLWISAGLVEPGKAQWVAALATGFLLAKIVLLVGDLIDSCAKGKFKDSYIAKFFIWFFSTPITNLVKISCLLFLVYIFQFILLDFVSFPLRTYLTNIFQFIVGVTVSYFLSRKFIFKLKFNDGSYKEFFKYVSISFINLFVPLFVWFLINLWNENWQQNEMYVLIITTLIHGSILPIKYLIYKFFVFKDSL